VPVSGNCLGTGGTWANPGNTSAANAKAAMATTYPMLLATPIPTVTSVTRSLSDANDTNAGGYRGTCGVAGSGCSSCSTHSHSVCRFTSGAQSPFSPCIAGANCVIQSNYTSNPNADIIVWEQTTEICKAVPAFVYNSRSGNTPSITQWKECRWRGYSKVNDTPVYQYNTDPNNPPSVSCSASIQVPNNAVPNTPFKNGDRTTSNNSARAAIDLTTAEQKRLFNESNVLTFTLQVCNADEEAVAGGGSCPNGKVAFSKRYGTNCNLENGQCTAAPADQSPYPRNWVLGCLDVADVLNRAMGGTPSNPTPFPLRISAQCCKNGKTNNAGTTPSGPNPNGSDDYFLTGSNHTQAECRAITGASLETVGTLKICKFSANAANNYDCPSGWTMYPNVQELASRSTGDCQGVLDSETPGSCSSSPQNGVLPYMQFGISPFQSVEVKNVGPLLSSCGFYYTKCTHKREDRLSVGCR